MTALEGRPYGPRVANGAQVVEWREGHAAQKPGVLQRDGANDPEGQSPPPSAPHGQRVAQALDLPWLDAVVGPASSLLTAQQACVVQHLAMVADGGLGQSERPRELRLAHLAAGVIDDQAEDPEASRLVCRNTLSVGSNGAPPASVG